MVRDGACGAKEGKRDGGVGEEQELTKEHDVGLRCENRHGKIEPCNFKMFAIRSLAAVWLAMGVPASQIASDVGVERREPLRPSVL